MGRVHECVGIRSKQLGAGHQDLVAVTLLIDNANDGNWFAGGHKLAFHQQHVAVADGAAQSLKVGLLSSGQGHVKRLSPKRRPQVGWTTCGRAVNGLETETINLRRNLAGPAAGRLQSVDVGKVPPDRR